MNAETSLEILTVLADFLLKITLAFGLFWGVNRLVTRANRRFALWLSFLAGAGLYWIWTLHVFLGHATAHPGLHSAQPVAMTSAIAWNTLELPGAWAFPLGIGLRAMVCAYFFVLCYFLASFVRKSMHLRWVIGFTSKPPDEIAGTFRFLVEQLSIRNCELLLLNGITSPATIGWIRPIVLLPSHCCERDAAETEDILRHELHHIRRYDYLLSRVAGIFEVLLFFHPLVWYAKRQLELERELACDFAVVADSPHRRLKYAECLVSFARLNDAQEEKAWGVDFASASSYLKTRLQTILHEPKHQSRWMSWARSSAIVMLIIVFLNILPALAVVFAYIRADASQPPTTVARVSHPRQRKRTAPVKKTPVSELDEEALTSPGLSTSLDDVEALSIPQGVSTNVAPVVLSGSSTPSDLDHSTASSPESPKNQTSSRLPQGGSKGPRVKMPTVTSLVMRAILAAGGLAAGSGHADSGPNEQNFR